MDLIIYSLKSIAIAIVEPIHLLMLIIFGVIFYFRNIKISTIQKMTLGESLNSPLELTLSQIVLGILAGAIGTIILAVLGVTFKENSGIEFLFVISILLLFYKKKFASFAYSGAILGIIGIVVKLISNITNQSLFFDINILYLTTFIGVIYIVEGILIMVDGGRGYVPVFSKKKDNIVGGFSFNRYWALPIALFMIFSDISPSIAITDINIPTWWPVLNKVETLKFLATTLIISLPLYGIVGYSNVTFTLEKKKKTFLSGMLVLIYGVSVAVVAQLSNFNLIGQIISIAFIPLGYEAIIRIEKKLESKKSFKYISDDEGIMVLDVAPKSPAFEAGIRCGDKILAINGENVTSEIDIFKEVKQSIFKVSMKIKKASGQVEECFIQPRNKRIGILMVPKMVKVEDAISFDSDNFKKILEELKSKK